MGIEAIKEGDLEAVDELLRGEGHPMVQPTHVLRNDTGITGALAIASCTPIQMFLSKKNTNKLDILAMRRFVKRYCDSISNNHLVVQMGPRSPGWDIMNKIGAKYVGKAHYWYYEI